MKNILLLLSVLFFTINAIGQTASQWKEFGKMKHSVKNYKMAIHDFSQAIEITPNDHELFYLRGLSNYTIFNFSSALDDFNKVIDLRPGIEITGVAYAYRGLAKINMKQNENGCIDLNTAADFFSGSNAEINKTIEQYCNTEPGDVNSPETNNATYDKASSYTEAHPDMKEASKNTNKTKLTDIDGTTYKVVQIGNQLWMGENLNVGRFRNGDIIPHAKTSEEWENAKSTKSPAWCYYKNDPANGKTLGKLYNWHAVNDKRGLAPNGWHIPSNKEWTALIKNQGGPIAGVKMKSMRMWYNAKNEKKAGVFDALPAGMRRSFGDLGFHHGGPNGSSTFWWSSDTYEKRNVWALYSYEYGAKNKYWSAGTGISVRCISN